MSDERETGSVFDPKFDDSGLLSAVVTNAENGALLMVGYMDQEALDATLATGKVHFHSRSRDRLWMKGESSGHFLNLVEILVDCDQDAVLVIARPDGPTCHTGERSCFYRRLTAEGLQRL
jgi:phosphoribosyl-AMP cyclohydrolase